MRHRNIARRGVSRFAFIDLFAGIGGMRMAFEHAGGTCLYSSEWNKYSQQTYRANFGETPDGDITKADENALPPCREKPVMRTILERNVPDTFKIVVSDTQAYRQFGNSVVVPLMERIAERIIGTLETAADAASERRCAI